MRKYFLSALYLCVIYFFIPYSLASTPTFTDLWSVLTIQGNVPGTSSFLYDLNSQARYNITDDRYLTTRNELGLGYKISSDFSAWLGYTWFITPNHIQTHIPWEQIIWSPKSGGVIDFSMRTRLTEANRIGGITLGASQWAVIWRQRFTLSLAKKIANTFTPLIYDEIFFQCNHPAWVNNDKFIEQNRFFVGFNMDLVKHVGMQIGYLNRYLFQNIRNRMDHIIYLNLIIKT